MALIFDTVRTESSHTHGSTNNAKFIGDAWGTKHQTDNGYILLGPANSSHAHIYTDRANFYFNKQIQLLGNTLINQNDIQSNIFYDRNNTAYYVDPNGTSNLSALNVGGYAVLTAGSSIDADTLDGFQLDSSSNTGARASVIPYIKSDSVMEIGKYIDFHDTGSTADYDIRLSSSSSRLNVDGGYFQVNGVNSVRASFFYDLDNTNYYLNPAGQSLFGNGDGPELKLGPNTSYSKYLYLGGWGTSKGDGGWVRTSNGNLHLDAALNYDTYLNHYHGGLVRIAGGGGYAYIYNSARAPIFYDLDNTTYYTNPASRSELTATNMSLNDATALTDGTFNVSKTIKGGIHFTNGAGTGTSNGYQASITFQGSSASESQAGIYVHNNNSAGTYMALATTNNYGNGPQIALRIDNNGKIFADRNFIQSNTDMRAPIFYDSDNTGYYVNPAASSKLVYLGLAIDPYTSGSYRLRMGGSIHMNANNIDYVNQLHFNDNVRLYDVGNDSYLAFRYGDATTGGIQVLNGSSVQQGFLYADSNGFGLLSANGTWAVRTTNSATVIDHRLDTPIVYDSDNTAYYVDPASQSNLNTLSLGGRFEPDDPDGYTSSTITGLTNAPIYYPEANVGTSDLYVPHTHSRTRYSGGYRAHISTGVHALANTWNYRYYIAQGGNDSYPTKALEFDVYNNNMYHSDGFIRSANDFYVPKINIGAYSEVLGLIGMGSAYKYGMGISSAYTCVYAHNYGSGVKLGSYDGSTFSEKLTVTHGGDTTATSSLRAPIFYDSNNTAYYVNPASDSSFSGDISLISGGIGSNADGSSTDNQVTRILVPEGGAASWDGAQTGAIKIRLPIRANNNMWSMKVRIYDYSVEKTQEYLLGNYSYSNGGYNSSASFHGGKNATPRTVRFGNDGTYDCVWIGETNQGWSYPVVSILDFQAGFRGASIGTNVDNYDISIVTSFGTVQTTISPDTKAGSTVYAQSSFRAPLFYDSNDTGYYVDAASTSNFNTVQAQDAIRTDRYEDVSGNFMFRKGTNAGTTSGRHLNLADTNTDPSDIGTHAATAITWGQRSDNNPYYIIRCRPSYNNGYSTHSRLDLSWHTGIEIGASSTYGGTRFFNNSSFTGTEIMRVGSGNNNVYINYTAEAGNDFRSPIWYDSGNTGYYINGDSTSRLFNLNVTHFGIINSSQTSRDGISLYGGYTGGEPTYGLLFTGTTGFGGHGGVTSDWATYFTMNNDNTRGWIFRRVGSGNCASISARGNATFDGYVKATNLGINTAADANASTGGIVKIQGATNGVPGLRVDSAAYSSAAQFYFGYNGTGITVNNNAGYNSSGISFKYGGTSVGSITINSSSTSYNTSSDYRLKENLIPITDGIERVKLLQPKRFNFIGEDTTVDGFVAHEAQEVVPEAVTGEKDGVDYEGNPEYQGIDQAKLVPLLTAALQEAIAKIEDLESRLQALENQ